MASEQTYQKYRRMARYPLFVAGLMFILGIGLVVDPHPPTELQHSVTGRTLTLVAWAMFLADYVISLILAPNKPHYLKTHIPQALGVLFPPLRIFLIFHVTFEVVKGSRAAFGKRLRLYMLYVSTLVILVSSVAVLIAERNATGATIVSFGDSLWWAAETISTVGYGDMYPVTVLGRVVAVTLMVNGLAILSVLTATVSQTLMSNSLGIKEPKTPPTPEPET